MKSEKADALHTAKRICKTNPGSYGTWELRNLEVTEPGSYGAWKFRNLDFTEPEMKWEAQNLKGFKEEKINKRLMQRQPCKKLNLLSEKQSIYSCLIQLLK